MLELTDYLLGPEPPRIPKVTTREEKTNKHCKLYSMIMILRWIHVWLVVDEVLQVLQWHTFKSHIRIRVGEH